jgi:hypothetical protein
MALEINNGRVSKNRLINPNLTLAKLRSLWDKKWPLNFSRFVGV